MERMVMAWINRPIKDRSNDDRKKERQQVYNTSRWRKLRELKLQLSPCCEICGSIENLNVHHITSPFGGYLAPDVYDTLAYDINNLQTLCAECHQKLHNGKLGS